MKIKKVRDEKVPPNEFHLILCRGPAQRILQRQTPTALKRKQSFLVGKSCDRSHGK